MSVITDPALGQSLVLGGGAMALFVGGMFAGSAWRLNHRRRSSRFRGDAD